MIGARCIVEISAGVLLHGKVVAEESDVTPAGGPAWRVRLDVPVLDPFWGIPCKDMHANKNVVHLES